MSCLMGKCTDQHRWGHRNENAAEDSATAQGSVWGEIEMEEGDDNAPEPYDGFKRPAKKRQAGEEEGTARKRSNVTACAAEEGEGPAAAPPVTQGRYAALAEADSENAAGLSEGDEEAEGEMSDSSTVSDLQECKGAFGYKIVDGNETAVNSRPYMVFLLIQRPNKTVACGGSLIRQDVVLTAAHCNGDQNVANARLIQYAQINTPVAVNNPCSVAGWGQTANLSHPSDVLREVQVTVQQVNAQTINARGTGRRGVCRGDSGGPLICNGVNIVVGVASYIRPGNCDDPGRNDVYTKVSAYSQWINQTMGTMLR
ncbi:MCT1A protease, partial [Polypterus senegalus]